MTGRRRSDRLFRAASGRTATVFAALLAVFLQAFVVQTHIHAAPFAPIKVGVERSLDTSGETHVSIGSEHQRFCVVCQTLAAAGAAMLPSAASPIAADTDDAEAVAAIARAPRAHTHSWRSRAPPSFL